MRLVCVLLVMLGLVGLVVLANCNVMRPAQQTGPIAQICPPDTLYHVDAYRWPMFAALRFERNGQLLTPPGPLTQRTCGDWNLQQQFRFSHLYFIDNTPDVSMQRNVRRIWCAQGRDTMWVVFWPYYHQNVLYDSIPFRPGTLPIVCPLAPMK